MTTAAHDIQMDDLLSLVVDENASNLHLAVGDPPVLRISGSLQALESDRLQPEDTERLMRSITCSLKARSSPLSSRISAIVSVRSRRSSSLMLPPG